MLRVGTTDYPTGDCFVFLPTTAARLQELASSKACSEVEVEEAAVSVEVMESYREELLKTAPYHVCSTQLCLTHAQSIREVLNGFMDEGRLCNH